MLQVVLGVLGLALAWTTFRITHDATARAATESARGLLASVRAGMVEHRGGPGWGEAFLRERYTEALAIQRATTSMRSVEHGFIDQVFVVPTEPLELLARASPQVGFISVETVSAANVALWRLKVLNQLVGQQTLFNALHVAEMTDPATTTDRRAALAEATRVVAYTVLRQGIGEANAPGGWYRNLKEALSGDIATLERRGARPWWRRALDEPAFAVVDVVAWGGVLAALVVALAAG